MATLPVFALAAQANAELDAGRSDDRKSLALVVGGDLGLGGSRQPISPRGGYRHGRLTPWRQLTAGIAPLLDGDINFANLETVVSDRRTLRPASKAFNFMMHPDGVRHLVGIGFNVLSTANNHAIDFGQAGLHQTMRHLTELRGEGLLAAPGIGRGRDDAMRPSIIRLKGHKIGVSALGIGGGGRLRANAGRKRIGQMGYNARADFEQTVRALGGLRADYRILSVHYGQERDVRPSRSAIAKLRDYAVRETGVDLVLGHHAHVAAGVQSVDGRIIFYGLGNLLHLGMQDMAKFGPCRDYGLIARVHLAAGEDGRLRAYAVEAVALTRMHDAARPMSAAKATRRIEVLNRLAAELDDPARGARGLRFATRADGSGLHCFPGADTVEGRIGELCRGWQAPQGYGAGRRNRGFARCGLRVRVARSKRRRSRSANRRVRKLRAQRPPLARNFRVSAFSVSD